MEKRQLGPSTPLEIQARKPLFDLLAERLVFSDSFKDRMASLTPAEQLAAAETMKRPPQNAAEREFNGEIIWKNVVLRFENNKLSSEELRLWKNPNNSAEHIRLQKKFDAFLLEQFRYFGPALLLSYGALERIFTWRERDPHKMKLLSAELELNSRRARGESEARFTIGEELANLKPQAVKDLRVLFPKVREEFFKKSRTAKDIVVWIERTIKEQPTVFQCLNRNAPQLKGFLLAAPEDLVLGIVTGRTRAPSFVDAWIASATGYSVPRARQEMSRHRS